MAARRSSASFFRRLRLAEGTSRSFNREASMEILSFPTTPPYFPRSEGKRPSFPPAGRGPGKNPPHGLLGRRLPLGGPGGGNFPAGEVPRRAGALEVGPGAAEEINVPLGEPPGPGGEALPEPPHRFGEVLAVFFPFHVPYATSGGDPKSGGRLRPRSAVFPRRPGGRRTAGKTRRNFAPPRTVRRRKIGGLRPWGPMPP